MAVMRLKTVVFPAPFGPITLMISLGQICRSTSCTAASPPKYLVTLLKASRGVPVCSLLCSTFVANSIAPSCSMLVNMHFRLEAGCSWRHIQWPYFYRFFFFNMMQFASSPCAGNKPFWPEDHDCDKNDTKNQVANIAESETRYELGNADKDGMQETGWIRRYTIELSENKFVDSINSKRTHDDTGDTANTTNDHHSKVNHRITKAKVIR